MSKKNPENAQEAPTEKPKKSRKPQQEVAPAEKPKKAPVLKSGYEVRVVGTPPGAGKGEVFDQTYRVPAGSSGDAELWGRKQAASLSLSGVVVQIVSPVLE
jgi:hypothetical protein